MFKWRTHAQMERDERERTICTLIMHDWIHHGSKSIDVIINLYTPDRTT